MSTLHKAVEEYLSVRRALGYDLSTAATQLRGFASFLERNDTDFVTISLALRWAQHESRSTQPPTWADRLTVVRKFAAWRSLTDARTEIPPRGLLPQRRRRKPPYIYSDTEIERIVARAAQLPSPLGLRGPTYSTLFALLATTGLRLGETLALTLQDVDFENGVIFIRKSKLGKARYVPIHKSTKLALARYAATRDRILPHRSDDTFFVTERGRRFGHGIVEWSFAKVLSEIGLRAYFPLRGPRGRGPRLHDMRHRFATSCLLAWYRDGLDVERELPKLATYLGHAHVRYSYWYLEAIPELLQLATERFARKHEEMQHAHQC
jgi:integrase